MLKSAGKLFAVAFGQQAEIKNVFHRSDKCPDCGTPLMRVETAWRCPNLDCPAQIRARIEHWCSSAAMDIAGIDSKFAALLVSNGLARDVAELYRIRIAELAGLPGMNNISAKQLFDEITASQKREAWRLLFGLSIPQLSPGEAQSLCAHFKSADNVFAASVERLMQAPGVHEATARGIVQWHSDSVNRKLVKRLFKAGLNFKA